MAAKESKNAGSGLILGQALLAFLPLELFVSDPDGGIDCAARELLTVVAMAVSHVGDVTKDLVLDALAKATS